MEPYKRDFFIARIRAGYVPVTMGDYRFVVNHPNIDTAICAQESYIRAYEQAQEEGLLAEDELLDWLYLQNLWTEEDEKNYQKVVPDHIEYWKIELFNASMKSNTRKTIRKYLQAAKEEYVRLHSLRHYYDYVTVDGYATYVRNMYLISRCATLNGAVVDWEQHSLHRLMGEYHKEILMPEEIRELARTSPWSGLWTVLKLSGKIFSTDELTVEQQSLLSWTHMYDKIYESPDCPSDEVISDDDMLDGWLLVQKRKRDAEKQKQEVESHINPRMKNADEIYMIAETAEDAQKIDMMNPEHVKRIKKNRIHQVKSEGMVRQQEFKDVQQKRSMDMQRVFSESIKGRR
jgi:hypothetical protein